MVLPVSELIDLPWSASNSLLLPPSRLFSPACCSKEAASVVPAAVDSQPVRVTWLLDGARGDGCDGLSSQSST